jgi:RNA polymerase sigma factor (TIGR02999 family)
MIDVINILGRVEAGDPHAADQLLPIVYNELRQLASRRLAQERPGELLQTTELVHEAYLRLLGPEQAWDGKAHFFAAAAEAMRRILVERARQRKQIKRGGQYKRVELTDAVADDTASPEEVLLVNDVLDRFAEQHPVEALIVKLHYFAGFNISEAARALGVPVTTAHRHWTYARTWLYRELQRDHLPARGR